MALFRDTNAVNGSLKWKSRETVSNDFECWGNTEVIRVPFTGEFNEVRISNAINPIVRRSFNPGRVQRVFDNNDGYCEVQVFYTCTN